MPASAAEPGHSGFPLGEQSPLSGPSPLQSCRAEAICSSWLLAVKWPSLFLATMILICARSVQISGFNFSVWSCSSEERSGIPSQGYMESRYMVVRKNTGQILVKGSSRQFLELWQPQPHPPFPCVVIMDSVMRYSSYLATLTLKERRISAVPHELKQLDDGRVGKKSHSEFGILVFS